MPDLDSLLTLGAANGAEGLEIVGPDFVRQREPHVQATRPSGPGSGRLEAEALVRVLQRIAEAAGAIVLRDARVSGGNQRPDGTFEVRLARDESRHERWSTPQASTRTTCRRPLAESRSRSTRFGETTRN